MSPIARNLKRRPGQAGQKRARGWLRPNAVHASGLLSRLPRIECLEDRRLLAAVPFGTFATDLRGDLEALESRIVNSLNDFATGQNSSLPFVGDRLGDAAKAISGFSTQLYSAIAALGSVDEPAPAVLQDAIFGTLGPGGLNLLSDRDGNGVNASDILISAPGGTLSSNFSVDMHLHGTVASPDTPLAFDTGLPGLPLKIETDGTIGIAVAYDFELAFSYDAVTHSVTLDDTKRLSGTDSQIAFAVSADLQGFSATATMGFVQGSLSALPGQTNSLSLAVGLNNLNSIPAAEVSAMAEANLQLDGSFAGTEGDFPGIDADLHLTWSIDSENPNAAPPDVSIDNVYLDLGKFLSNVVKPVFEKIQIFTHPLDPILEVLGYPLPGLSDLSRLAGGDDVDLLDLGGVAALVTGFGPLYDLVHKVLNVIDKLNDFEVGETVRMKLGGFDLADFDLRNTATAADPTNLNVRNLTDLSPSNLVGIAQSLAEKVDELPLSDEEKELIKGFAEQLNNGFSIQFPVLEHPESAIFPLLLGRDSDLFTLDAEMHVSARGSVATGYSFFGVGIDFGGEVEIDTKFKFAYDTFGLRSLISDLAAGNTSAETIAKDVVAGFYVGSDSYFTLAGDVYAGAGASIGVFSAVVGGFIATEDSGTKPVSISINDPNGDGKLRFDEFGEDAINLEGKFSAALGIEVRVGFEVFGKFVGVKKRFDIAQKTLVNFDGDETGSGAPILASQPDINGNIQLYVGALAGERRNVDQTNGNERLRIQHVETTSAGETIDISIRQSLGGFEYDATQRITGVRSITASGDQGDLTIDVLTGVTSNVHFEGGLGHADFIYDGRGDAYLEAGDLDSYLSGGFGNNTLVGLGGNDTISLGHAGNSVQGGGGTNTIIVSAPLTQGGVVSGGDTTNNQLVVIAGDKTAAVNLGPDSPGAIRLSYNELTGGPYPNLILTNFDTVAITAQDRQTNIHIGELSGAGVQTVFVNIPTTGQGGRSIELDTRAQLGLSDISLQPFEHEYSTADGGTVVDHAIAMTNATTGVMTYLMGVAPDDVTTIVQHGGTATVGPLSNDNGTIVFDTSSRPAGQNEVVFMQTPALDEGSHIATSDGDSGEFVFDADLYPTIKFRGLAANDSIDLDVSAPLLATGVNTVYLDASNLAGRLDVDLLGTGALNQVAISQLAAGASIDVDGLASSTQLTYGVGVLADILGGTAVHNVELAIDNKDAVITSQLLISDTELHRRSNPDDGHDPAMTYDGLRGTFTVYAGPGDRLGLNQTPAGIDGMYFTNPSQTIDPLYVKAASADLLLEGGFSLYLGREIDLAGNVTRISHLAPIGVTVQLEYTGYVGDDHAEIVLDAALDPTGATYLLGDPQIAGFTIKNLATGLHVIATGMVVTDPDDLRLDVKLYVTGANVGVDLLYLTPATITVDGNDRFAGANPTGANDISVTVPIGEVALNPVGQYDSVLLSSDPVYVLGSMPQDELNVSIATSTTLSPAYSNPAVVFGYGVFIADANYLADNPRPDAWALRTNMEFYGRAYEVDPYYGATAPELTSGGVLNLPYSIYSSRSTGGLSYQQVYLDPNAHYDPPLPTDASSDAYFYELNLPPVNSQMQMNASQLRGRLNINVQDPDYQTASSVAEFFKRLTEHIYQAGGQVGYSEVAAPYPRYNVAFGQTYVNLTHVGAETTVNVQGVNNPPQSSNTPYYSSLLWGMTTIPRAHVNLGAGDLANINGPVSFDIVELTIDGSHDAEPRILQLDSSTFSGWEGNTGATPTATLYTLLDTFTMIGSATDSFSILQTPTGPTKVSVVNGASQAPSAASMALVAGEEPVAQSLAGEAETPGVYLAGKKINQILEVDGHFEFYIGRRLNPDGSVESASSLYNFVDFDTISPLRPKDGNVITYSFVGEGPGRLVYDVSPFIDPGWGLHILAGNISEAAYPGKGVLFFDRSDLGGSVNVLGNKVVFPPNTDLSILAPRNGRMTIENPVTATIRYTANTLADDVRIYSTNGPVFVTGAGASTRVSIQPKPGTPGDLRDLIHAPITVTDAALRVQIDTDTTPTLQTLPDIVLNADSLAGFTEIPIHFERLVNYSNANGTMPGLHVGLPRSGAASLTILDTPVGIATGFNTVGFGANGVPIGPVQVLGTTGELWFGVQPFPADFISVSRYGFRAASVTFGDGTLENIRGNVRLGGSGSDNIYTTAAGTVLDNHADIPRDVIFGNSRASVDWMGLAPGGFLFFDTIAEAITILGSPGSNYRLSHSTANVRLMAGEGSTVDVVSGWPDGMAIYGAARVTITSVYPRIKAQEIFPDPSRPNDITELVADYVNYAVEFWVDKAADGRGEIWLDRSDLHRSLVLFPPDTTRLTVLRGDASQAYQMIHVLDTVAISTTISPGRANVEVNATTRPLTINVARDVQNNPADRSPIVLGNAGNMQSLLGPIAINVLETFARDITVELNSTADATPRTIQLDSPEANHWVVSGLAPTPIEITGSHARPSIRGGSGVNTLVGPDVPSAWELTSTGGGTLNTTLTFAGMQNLTGGSANDDFFIRTSGQIAGNLDGGDGTDTVHYISVLDGSETIDLAAGVLPRVGGLASNIEFVDVVMPIALQNPGNQTGKAGAAITPLQIVTTGGAGAKTFSATGLPTGLSIDAATGIISGTISPAINPGTNFNVNVSVSDATGSKNVSFSWTVQSSWSIVNPGPQLTPLGLSVSLQIQVDNPLNAPLTYSASGLPGSLSINSTTGLITGSVNFYYQVGLTFPVTIRVNQGSLQNTLTFDWTLQEGFQLFNGWLYDYAGAMVDWPLVENPYEHDITVTAEGLPLGVTVNAAGNVVGTLDPLSFLNQSVYEVHLTAVDHTIGDQSASSTFYWYITAPTVLGATSNQTSYAGTEIELPLWVQNEFDHALAFEATGLPPGLSIDATGVISGKIDAAAAAGGPYYVSIVLTDLDFDYSTTDEFQWTVLPPLSIDELNAGTPEGSPILATLVDPFVDSWIQGPISVSFASNPGGAASIYFAAENKLWVLDGQEKVRVPSVDPNYPSISPPRDIIALPGRGILFGDDDGHLWFADQEGARVISDMRLRIDGSVPVVVGDSMFLLAYSTASFQQVLLRVDFSGTAGPRASQLTTTGMESLASLHSFGDKLVYTGQSSDENGWFYGVFLHDPVTDEPALVDTGDYFTDVTIVAAGNGSDNLFYVNRASDGSAQLRAVNSDFPGAPTALATFAADIRMGSYNYPAQPPLVVGDKIEFITTQYDSVTGNNTTQFWTSDGTVAGTHAVGATLVSRAAVAEQIAFAGSVYFFYQFYPYALPEVTPETITIQLWKLDPETGAFSLLHDYFGPAYANVRPIDFTVVGDFLYFTARDESSQNRLWRLAAGDSAPTLVPAQPGNEYVDPSPRNGILVDGRFYFMAGSQAITTASGRPSQQLWSVAVPVVDNVPGDLDGDGIVTASDIDSIWGLIQAGDSRADLNHDGVVDQADADYLIRVILNTEYGDVNLDGFVDADDLAETRRHIGQVFSGPNWAGADFNGDGISDAADLAVVRRYSGFASLPAAPAASVAPASQPAVTLQLAVQPEVAPAGNAAQVSSSAALAARMVRETTERIVVQPVASLLVADLDDLTELIAKATAGRRRNVLA